MSLYLLREVSAATMSQMTALKKFDFALNLSRLLARLSLPTCSNIPAARSKSGGSVCQWGGTRGEVEAAVRGG